MNRKVPSGVLSLRQSAHQSLHAVSGPLTFTTITRYVGHAGVLRKHMILPDGRYRHSVFYSILDSE